MPRLPASTQLPLSLRPADGFTLLEILAVGIILAILAVLFVPHLQGHLNKAREVACLGHMRGITVALHAYLHDHRDVWPQGPLPIDKNAWESFWLATLHPYGIGPNDWRCPSITASLATRGISPPDMPKIHYQPAVFPPTPGSAMRYTTQPWLIERANVHGHGPLIAFPDGKVKAARRIVAELGTR